VPEREVPRVHPGTNGRPFISLARLADGLGPKVIALPAYLQDSPHPLGFGSPAPPLGKIQRMRAGRRTSFTHVFNYRYIGCYHPREAVSTDPLPPCLGHALSDSAIMIARRCWP